MAGSRKRVRMTDDAPPHPRDGGHRDLKDKALNEIVPIRSAEAPLPRKTSLRRGTLQDEAAAVNQDSDLEAALKFGSDTEGEDSSDEEQAVERIAPEQLPKASKKKRKSSQQSESDTVRRVFLPIPSNRSTELLPTDDIRRLPWPDPTRLLRGSNAGVLFAIWRGDTAAVIAKQKGAQGDCKAHCNTMLIDGKDGRFETLRFY